jgi:hypothetical protein
MNICAKVNHQSLTLEVPDTMASESQEYLTISFKFSEDWDNLTKTVVFQQAEGPIYNVLLTGDSCTVPAEVLESPACVYVGVFGVNGDARVTTTIASFRLYQGSYKPGETPPEPTPDIYAQILTALDKKPDDAPIDGTQYGRENGSWTPITGGGGGGAVHSVTGEMVDNTDPSRPVINHDEVYISQAIAAALQGAFKREFNGEVGIGIDVIPSGDAPTVTGNDGDYYFTLAYSSEPDGLPIGWIIICWQWQDGAWDFSSELLPIAAVDLHWVAVKNNDDITGYYVMKSGDGPDNLPKWELLGPAAVDMSNYYNKSDINNLLLNYLTRSLDEINQLYAHFADGNDGVVKFGGNPEEGTIPYRYIDGRIKAGEPVDDQDVTTKAYVDSATSGGWEEVGSLVSDGTRTALVIPGTAGIDGPMRLEIRVDPEFASNWSVGIMPSDSFTNSIHMYFTKFNSSSVAPISKSYIPVGANGYTDRRLTLDFWPNAAGDSYGITGQSITRSPYFYTIASGSADIVPSENGLYLVTQIGSVPAGISIKVYRMGGE